MSLATTFVGESDQKFENKTLKVTYIWKFGGYTFQKYLCFGKQSNTAYYGSTGDDCFQCGFLASTVHNIQFYIDPDDDDKRVYLKIYLEETKVPYGFTDFKLDCPRVKLRLPDCQDWGDIGSIIVNEEIKQKLIQKEFLTNEDFETNDNSKIYWFRFEPYSTRYDNYGQQREYPLKEYIGTSLTFDFEFDYCFWNKNKSRSHHNVTKVDKAIEMKKGLPQSKPVIPTEEFLFSARFSDFVIQCGTKSFNAHRIIIAGKSIVFAAMLEQPMKEVNEGRLAIDDFPPEVVEEFLRFIYTGSANINDYSKELFKISHKYEVNDLKDICENTLMSQVNGDNLIEVNELGKLYNSNALMDTCYSYFKSQRSSLVKSQDDVVKFSEFFFRFNLE